MLMNSSAAPRQPALNRLSVFLIPTGTKTAPCRASRYQTEKAKKIKTTLPQNRSKSKAGSPAPCLISEWRVLFLVNLSLHRLAPVRLARNRGGRSLSLLLQFLPLPLLFVLGRPLWPNSRAKCPTSKQRNSRSLLEPSLGPTP